MYEPIRLGTPWHDHPATYRAKEIAQLASWIRVGASGAVLGLRGVGRSNLLGFLCHRPGVLNTHIDPARLAVSLVPVDLGDLPTDALADFYRVLLRAFYEVHHHFPAGIRKRVVQTYREHRGETDAFVVQSALREVLYVCQQNNLRIVMVVDRFDSFARLVNPVMAQALGALRDTFRDTLLYIVGIRQSLAYLADLDIDDDLYRLLTTHLCHLGPMTTPDAQTLIQQRIGAGGVKTVDALPVQQEIDVMLALSGGYPMLLQAICRWWLLERNTPLAEWREVLGERAAMQRRLRSIWLGLTQEEQHALTALVRGQITASSKSLSQARHAATLNGLVEKGVCRREAGDWALFGELFVDFVAAQGAMSRGRIWLDEKTDTLFHGDTPLSEGLSPKEEAVLRAFVDKPHERLSYTKIIVEAWADEEDPYAVGTEALFRVISDLRRKIEPQPGEFVYIVNLRGKPEGGYVFYPEGRPQ